MFPLKQSSSLQSYSNYRKSKARRYELLYSDEKQAEGNTLPDAAPSTPSHTVSLVPDIEAPPDPIISAETQTAVQPSAPPVIASNVQPLQQQQPLVTQSDQQHTPAYQYVAPVVAANNLGCHFTTFYLVAIISLFACFRHEPLLRTRNELPPHVTPLLAYSGSPSQQTRRSTRRQRQQDGRQRRRDRGHHQRSE